MQILKDEVKKRIIEASKNRFKTDGFQKASMRDIAKDAGISTGNIYRYFLTKTHLLDEILNDLQNDLEESLTYISEEYSNMKDKAVFKDFIDKIVALYEKHKIELEVMVGAKNEKQFVIFKENILNMFTNKIIDIAKSKEVELEDNTVIASVSRALFEGAMYIIEISNGNIEKLKKQLTFYMEIMVEDLDKRVRKVAKRGI